VFQLVRSPPTPFVPLSSPATQNTATRSLSVASQASEPPVTKADRPALILRSQLESWLGKYVRRDSLLVQDLGWEQFVSQQRSTGDLTSMEEVHHRAKPLLHHLSHRGALVITKDAPWLPEKLQAALHRGPHQSCLAHRDFLSDKFADFVKKGHWVVLSFSVASSLPGLRLSPPGVIPQHKRRPRLIADLTWAGVNASTVPLAPSAAMQFGRMMHRVISSVVRANPRYGHVHTMKVDLSDGFYRVWLQARNCPKLALVLPDLDGNGRPLVAVPLALPMGWVESPPWFSAVTETGANMANHWLCRNFVKVPPHRLDHTCNTPPGEPFSSASGYSRFRAGTPPTHRPTPPTVLYIHR